MSEGEVHVETMAPEGAPGAAASRPDEAATDTVAAVPTLALLKGGETVVVRTTDGARATGRLESFPLGEGPVSFVPLGSTEARSVEAGELKFMHIMNVARWNRTPLLGEHGDAVEVSPSEREFEVNFKDGDRLQGMTLGFRTDRRGIFLFPLMDGQPGAFFCTFVPHASMEDHRVGPRLGELLVEESLVGQEQVDAALAAQQAERARPVGETLLAKAAVTVLELERALEQQKRTPDRRIGDILVAEQLISEEQLAGALAAQKEGRRRPLGELLVDQGELSREDLNRALARKLGIPTVDLRKFQVDQDAARLVPEDVIQKHRVMPLYVTGSRLVIAMDNPLDWGPVEAVAFASNRSVDPVIASRAEIDRLIDVVYAGFLDESTLEQMELAQPSEEEEALRESAHAENVVVQVVNRILVNAWREGASDIHIEPYGARERTVVRVRRDGELRQHMEVPPKLRRAVVARIKVMAGLDVTERRRPQDGKIDMRRFGNLEFELRVATIPTAGGQEDVIIRVLANARPIPIASLGLSPDNQQRLLDVLEHPHGLLLVCGPTGSGKTTTLHSLLGHLNVSERKIWTAEDPVEITQPGLRQVQVNADIGLSFAAALRAFLRADPDVVMVGEMRDAETSAVAVEASLTGHLVLSTLHTNSAPESVSRLLDMGIDPFNFADALLGVLAQRLVRKLCTECKRPATLSEEQLEELLDEFCAPVAEANRDEPETLLAWRAGERDRWVSEFGDDAGRLTIYEPVGCEECDDSGYRGRIGVHELMVTDEALRSLIQRRASVSALRARALVLGMRTLRQDAILKLLYGFTDRAQIRSTGAA